MKNVYQTDFAIQNGLGRYAFNWEQRNAITYSAGIKNLPVAVGLALASFPHLVGLPVALAMILQMLTASMFYRFLSGQAQRRSRCFSAGGEAGLL